MQRRRIVDAVAQIPDDMTARFEREDHPIFLRRVDPAKQIGLFRPDPQGGVIHPPDFFPRQHAFHRYIQGRADVLSD